MALSMRTFDGWRPGMRGPMGLGVSESRNVSPPRGASGRPPAVALSR